MQPTGATTADTVPIIYSQKFIYNVLTQLGPRAPLLQITTCLRIRGPIDVARFERAAAALVVRHPILRSRLELRNGEVFQRQDGRTPPLEVLDVDGGAEQQADTERRADLLLSARADQPFDLFEDNPFRVVLVRIHPGEAYLMLLAHHMFVDARGLQFLLRDYLDLVLADRPDVEPPPWDSGERSYLSFARREQQTVRDGTFARRTRYWLDYLDRADPAVRLPNRGPDPAVQSLAAVPFTLGGESYRAFTDRARRLGAVPFALAAASIFHALSGVTGQDDLMLSVVADTRVRPFEQTVGNFTEFLVVSQDRTESRLSDDTIRALSGKVMRSMKNYVPLLYLGDHVGPFVKRGAKGYSMTEVSVNYMPTGVDPSTLAGLDGYQLAPFYPTARTFTSDIPYHGVVMAWVFMPQKDSLSGFLRYESTIVDEEVAQRVVRSFVTAATGRDPAAATGQT